MGCFNSKDDFPTQEVMVAVAGIASGKVPKPELRRVSVDGERESTRTSSQNDEIPRVVIHKGSTTASQEQAAVAAGALPGSAEGEAGGQSPRKGGNVTRRDGAADETNRGGDVERTDQGKDERATRPLGEKGEGERLIVVVEGDPSEDVPRVVVHREPEGAEKSAAPEVAAATEDIGSLPARDPRPETPALPVSAEVGSKGLQEAAAELRAASAEVDNDGEKNTLAAEEEHNTLAAPPVSVLPIVAEPGL